MTDEKKPPQGADVLQAWAMDSLDYIEAQAAKLTAFRLETMELLNKRAHTLVTLLLGGGGALAAFGIGLLEKQAQPWIVAGVLCAAMLLFVVAGVGAWRCLSTEVVYPPGNEPLNLLPYRLQLDAMRLAELSSLQVRQEGWAAGNSRKGLWLNRLYMATALIPLAATVLALGVLWLVPGARV